MRFEPLHKIVIHKAGSYNQLKLDTHPAANYLAGVALVAAVTEWAQ